MREANISPEVVVTIIFGILQLIMAATALWQQHYLRWENFGPRFRRRRNDL
ncbi:unnamed protein product [Fusarium graminearum]|nr:hypothetical protein FG05_35050 [Fusarium graminearum]CZS79221.1 unnamed protein product [Fusarium graminearum]